VTVPANTIESFTQALNATNGIEFEVILSKDKVPVVNYDWYIKKVGRFVQ